MSAEGFALDLLKLRLFGDRGVLVFSRFATIHITARKYKEDGKVKKPRQGLELNGNVA